ncbi:MAG: GNAT family N-acetyltransferase, partial [Flavobacteriaceae bacterium]|nr:GNAT family N-acetyltransferase [Flavobacteriaceae bacterium]
MKTDKYILETARTKIRPLSPDDAEHFYSLNQDPEVLKYTGDDPFETVNAAKEFLQQYDQYEKYGLGRWAVISKEND